MTRDLVQLRRIFRHARILEMQSLEARLERSRRSLFRDLTAVGYHTSYTHGGRYYTLAEIPDFDEWGLWFHRDVGFSRAGTLKQTVAGLIEAVPDGRTHAELQHLLRVRIHNTLLELVRGGRIGRGRYKGALLYVSADHERGAEQLERRGEGDRALSEIFGEPTTEEAIEVLAETLRGVGEIPPPGMVAQRLAARDVRISAHRVQQVFATHGLVAGKKTAHPTSRRSRR